MESPNVERKRGKLSRQEEQFIRDNHQKISIGEIARAINRTEEPIRRFLDKNDLVCAEMESDDVKEMQLKNVLRSRPYWYDVKAALSATEIRRFEDNWVQIILQFREDILYTEELQVKQWLILEALVNRSMLERKENLDKASDLQEQLDELYLIERGLLTSEQQMEISNLEAQLGMIRATIGAFNTEHTKLLNEIKYIAKQLKATREERIQKIENSKTSFTQWLSALDEEDIREREGISMEVTKYAKDNAKIKLMEPHKYVDGAYDFPLLTHETPVENFEEEIVNGEATNQE